MKDVYIVVAVDSKNGIGKNGTLPWNLKKELQYFSKLTKETKDPNKQNMVIMGRKTWDSLPEKYKPLPERINFVLTRKNQQTFGLNYIRNDQRIYFAGDFDEAIACGDSLEAEKIFVIGGAQIFNVAINDPRLSGIYLTKIEGDFHCDTFFPQIPEDFKKHKIGEEKEGDISYEYLLYMRS